MGNPEKAAKWRDVVEEKSGLVCAVFLCLIFSCTTLDSFVTVVPWMMWYGEIMAATAIGVKEIFSKANVLPFFLQPITPSAEKKIIPKSLPVRSGGAKFTRLVHHDVAIELAISGKNNTQRNWQYQRIEREKKVIM